MPFPHPNPYLHSPSQPQPTSSNAIHTRRVSETAKALGSAALGTLKRSASFRGGDELESRFEASRAVSFGVKESYMLPFFVAGRGFVTHLFDTLPCQVRRAARVCVCISCVCAYAGAGSLLPLLGQYTQAIAHRSLLSPSNPFTHTYVYIPPKQAYFSPEAVRFMELLVGHSPDPEGGSLPPTNAHHGGGGRVSQDYRRHRAQTEDQQQQHHHHHQQQQPLPPSDSGMAPPPPPFRGQLKRIPVPLLFLVDRDERVRGCSLPVATPSPETAAAMPASSLATGASNVSESHESGEETVAAASAAAADASEATFGALVRYLLLTRVRGVQQRGCGGDRVVSYGRAKRRQVVFRFVFFALLRILFTQTFLHPHTTGPPPHRALPPVPRHGPALRRHRPARRPPPRALGPRFCADPWRRPAPAPAGAAGRGREGGGGGGGRGKEAAAGAGAGAGGGWRGKDGKRGGSTAAGVVVR